jgi:hypothetical protein
LLSAQLTFTVADTSRTQNPGQVAGLIDTTGGTSLADIADSAGYASEYLGTEQPLEGLGVVPDTTGALLEGATFTTTATAADLQLIRDILSANGLMTMAMFGSDSAAPDGATGQYWGDGRYGVAPVLSLTFSVPEPGSFVLVSLAIVGGVVCTVRRKAKG